MAGAAGQPQGGSAPLILEDFLMLRVSDVEAGGAPANASLPLLPEGGALRGNASDDAPLLPGAQVLDQELAAGAIAPTDARASSSFDVKALSREFSRGSVGGPGAQEAGGGFNWAALFSAPQPEQGQEEGEDSYVFTAERMVALSVEEEFAEGLVERSSFCDQTVADLVRRNPRLQTLWSALVATGLNVTLSGPGPATLLAPTDAAFDALRAEVLAGDADANRILGLELKRLLRYHLVPSTAFALAPSGEGGVRTEEVPSLEGGPLEVLTSTGAAVVNGRALVEGIDLACNGRVAVVSAVLAPPQPEGPAAAEEPRDTYPSPEEPFGQPGGSPASCAPGECCDVQPPGGFTCKEQRDWGKCLEPWMAREGWCRSACGFCGTDGTLGDGSGNNWDWGPDSGSGSGSGDGSDFTAADTYYSPSGGQCASRGLRYELYTEILGNTVDSLTESAKFRDLGPDAATTLLGRTKVQLKAGRRSKSKPRGARKKKKGRKSRKKRRGGGGRRGRRGLASTDYEDYSADYDYSSYDTPTSLPTPAYPAEGQADGGGGPGVFRRPAPGGFAGAGNEWELLKRYPAKQRNFGVRLCGTFCPPETGEYTFYQVVTDAGELYLGGGSPGGSVGSAPADLQRILSYDVAEQGVNRRWNSRKNGVSTTVFLEAGQRYTLEGLMKKGFERRRRPRFRIGVKLPSGQKQRPVRADFFETC